MCLRPIVTGLVGGVIGVQWTCAILTRCLFIYVFLPSTLKSFILFVKVEIVCLIIECYMHDARSLYIFSYQYVVGV